MATQILVDFFRVIWNEWSAGNRATAVGIALLPAWLLMSLGVLLVGGSIELALGIPGPSAAGTAIGVVTLVVAGVVLFGGSIWSLRRLSKTHRDRGPTVDAQVGGVDLGMGVRAGGISLGRPENVLACATFVTLLVMMVIGWGLLIIVGAVYDTVGLIPAESFPQITAVGYVLLIGLGIVFPFVGTVLAVRAIRRWISRQGLE
jgi:hypothetical protein